MNASSGMGMVGAIVWMVVLFGIMYFLMLRPQKKEQKRLQAMLNDMEVGDSIVTDRKSTRLNSSHTQKSRMPSSA